MSAHEYVSSEELQRHAADIAAAQETEEKNPATDRDAVRAVLSKHITKHKSTDFVRAQAKASERSADYQLDLSADIVVILEKIKNELR